MRIKCPFGALPVCSHDRGCDRVTMSCVDFSKFHPNTPHQPLLLSFTQPTRQLVPPRKKNDNSLSAGLLPGFDTATNYCRQTRVKLDSILCPLRPAIVRVYSPFSPPSLPSAHRASVCVFKLSLPWPKGGCGCGGYRRLLPPRAGKGESFPRS